MLTIHITHCLEQGGKQTEHRPVTRARAHTHTYTRAHAHTHQHTHARTNIYTRARAEDVRNYTPYQKQLLRVREHNTQLQSLLKEWQEQIFTCMSTSPLISAFGQRDQAQRVCHVIKTIRLCKKDTFQYMTCPAVFTYCVASCLNPLEFYCSQVRTAPSLSLSCARAPAHTHTHTHARTHTHAPLSLSLSLTKPPTLTHTRTLPPLCKKQQQKQQQQNENKNKRRKMFNSGICR